MPRRVRCSSPAARRDGEQHSPSKRRSHDAWRCSASHSLSTSRGSPIRRSVTRTTGVPGSASLRRVLAQLFRLLPGFVRLRIIRALPEAITAAGVFAGPPSVAHAEALLRSIDLRAIELDAPLDAICVGIPARRRTFRASGRILCWPPTSGWVLRSAYGASPRPSSKAAPRFCSTASTAASRIRRNSRTGRSSTPPGAGSIRRSSPRRSRPRRPTLTRSTRYRAGRACHPLLPYADWSVVRQQTDRLGTVIVGGCRDAAGARHFGFVPARSAGTALSLALGLSEGRARIGFLLAPPYCPLRVG